jgi:hypothetical protein
MAAPGRRVGRVSVWRSLAVECARGQVTDPAWNTVAARLVRKTGASALPVYFCGRNSVPFQLLGLINPRLRTLFLLGEFLQQREKNVQIRIGKAIPSELIANLDNDEEATEYLRLRTYLLVLSRQETNLVPTKMRFLRFRANRRSRSPKRFHHDSSSTDIAALPAERLLVENHGIRRVLPRALPNCRTRSMNSDASAKSPSAPPEKVPDAAPISTSSIAITGICCSGTKEKQELAGAYRAGNTDEIIRAHGIKGLYTNTVFRYDARLFLKIGSALELGRSFVRPEYQRQYAPAASVVEGHRAFRGAHPETPVLFGAVSISNEYSSLSREMIVRYFEQRQDQDEEGREFADLIQARTPFRAPSCAAGIAVPSAVCRAISKNSPSPSPMSRKMARACPFCSSSMRRWAASW